MPVQLSNIIGLVLSASVSLIGVSVTLVALIPVLIEVARSRSPNFFAGEQAKAQLKNYLSRLRAAIGFFGISIIISGTNLYYENIIAFLVAMTLFSCGLILLIFISLAIARQTINFIG